MLGVCREGVVGYSENLCVPPSSRRCFGVLGSSECSQVSPSLLLALVPSAGSRNSSCRGSLEPPQQQLPQPSSHWAESAHRGLTELMSLQGTRAR